MSYDSQYYYFKLESDLWLADYIRYICIILKDLLTLLQSTDLVWEIVLGDAENYWVSCIQNHDISINYVNSLIS